MKSDDLISYLYATNQLDQYLGYKGTVLKCPGCNSELYIYENNILCCTNCDSFTRYYKKEKIYNKKLTDKEKKEIKW